jgi:hypothetical protein
VRRWFGWVEERVVDPHVVDVLQSEVGVFEQVCGLRVYLERVVVEGLEVEAFGHPPSV